VIPVIVVRVWVSFSLEGFVLEFPGFDFGGVMVDAC